MKSIKIEKTYVNWVINLDEQGIRRLYDEIKKQIIGDDSGKTKIDFKLKFSDGSTLNTEEIEELFSEENKHGREIKDLVFISKNESESKQAILTFGERGINLEIVGPDRQWAYITKSIIEDRIKSLKETRLRKGYYLLISGIVIIILTYFFSPHLQSYLPQIFTYKEEGTRQIAAGGLIIFGIDILIFILISVMINKLYPNLTFLIGDGINRHDKRIKTRSNLMWGVVIAILVGIVVNFLSKIFKI